MSEEKQTEETECDVCGHILRDKPVRRRPYRHCRKVMRKMYAPTRSIYRGDGFTGAMREDR